MLAVGGLALGLTPAAFGGGPESVEVCGVSRCESVRLPEGLTALVDSSTEIPPPPVGPYYEVRAGSERDRWFFVPSSRALKWPIHGEAFNWLKVESSAVAPIQAGLRGLKPLAAPTLSEVLVGGRKAPDPVPYLRLFDRFPAVAPPEKAGRRVWIVLRSERASPWSVSIPLPFPKRSGPWVNGFNLLEYFPASNTLYRSGQFVRLPPDLAEEVERDAGFAVDSAEGMSVPWLLIGGVAVALSAGAVAVRYVPRLWRTPR